MRSLALLVLVLAGCGDGSSPLDTGRYQLVRGTVVRDAARMIYRLDTRTGKICPFVIAGTDVLSVGDCAGGPGADPPER